MAIRFVEHANIDKNRWDKCILQSTNPLVYAESWYLDVVAPKWFALIKDDYEAVMPIYIKKKLGISYVCQPHFCQQLGVFSSTHVSSQLLRKFINKIPWWIVKSDLQIYNTFPEIELNLRTNYILDLNRPLEILMANYDRQHRKNIKKAISAPLEFNFSTEVIQILDIYKNAYGDKYYQFNDDKYIVLQQLYQEASKRNKVETYEVKFKNEIVGGGVFMISSNNTFHYILGAPTSEGRKMNAIYFLIHQFIEKHAHQPSKLDFEGSTISSVAYFYKNFGAENIPYSVIRKKWILPY